MLFENSQDRDTIQSYAVNLASKAGWRLDVPDHLRGIFRRFESHAALLKQKYGLLKRSIRFDDVKQSFYMDVKLEMTGWHRIDQDQIKRISAKNPGTQNAVSDQSAENLQAERNLILLCEEKTVEPVIIDSEDNQSDVCRAGRSDTSSLQDSADSEQLSMGDGE